MALTNIQKNILSRIQKLARIEIISKSEAILLEGMWGNEFSTLPTDEEIQECAEFAHITAAELSAAAIALVAINATRGDFDTPESNVVKLLKIVDGRT